jgi:AAA domain
MSATPEERLASAGAATERRPPAIRPNGHAPAVAPPQEFGKLRLLTLAHLRSTPPRDYILKRLISAAELSVWWGPPKCGKSFLAFHIAYAVAQGRSVFGRRVKPCTVLYVAAEGTAGLAGRLHALEAEFGAAPRFFLIAQPVDLLHPFGDLPSLLKAAQAIKAGLIVLDTLNRMMSGGDENGSEDMGALITNAGKVQAETPAHVAIIHHGSKNPNGSTPRGHSSLIGAADLVVEVAKTDDGRRTATVRAAKDEAEGDVIDFRLHVVELGTDPDGDALTTCIVREEQPAALGPRLSAAETKARSILADVIAAEGTLLPAGPGFPDNAHGVPEGRWREECETRRLSTSEQRDSRTKAFNRAFKGLIAASAVATRDNLVWLVKPAAPEEG